MTKLAEIATRVCTPKELEALELRHAGLSLRQIAFVLDLSLTTVADRIRRAEQKVVIAERGGTSLPSS